MPAPPDKPEEVENLSYRAKDWYTLSEDLRFRNVTNAGKPVPEHIKEFGKYQYKKSNEARKRRGDDFTYSETLTKPDSEVVRESARKYFIKEAKEEGK